MWPADERLHVRVLGGEIHRVCWCRIEIIGTPGKVLVIET
jgi:hypothetical protein